MSVYYNIKGPRAQMSVCNHVETCWVSPGLISCPNVGVYVVLEVQEQDCVGLTNNSAKF